MLTKEMIKRAAEQNVLVFDRTGAENELTVKLAGLMLDICLLNYGTRLTDIYVPCNVKLPDDYPTVAGLIIHRIHELNCGNTDPSDFYPPAKLFEYFTKDLGGSLASGHKHLIIGAGPNNATILGSIK